MPNYLAPYEAERHRLVNELVPPGDGLAVEIGCHDGVYSQVLHAAGYEAVGFDIDVEILESARLAHPTLDFRLGSAAEAKDLGTRTATVCLEVIEHLAAADKVPFMADIWDATAPGGWLLISTPGRFSAMSIQERTRTLSWRSYDWWDPTHIDVVSARRFRALVRDAGFTIERFIGFHYLPQRLARPKSFEGPLAWLGFDLVILARRIADNA